jgi:hypothetical protein
MAVIATAASAVLALQACTGTSTTTSSQTIAQPSPSPTGSPSGDVLPRTVVVTLQDVQKVFPELTVETDMGADPTATGNPTGTRSVSFASSDGAKKITVSVDEYANPEDASQGYQEAVQKSEAAPGFESMTVPVVGDQAFAGKSTQDGVTHIGMGVLTNNLVVGATTAGYDANAANIAKLVALMGAAITVAKNR